MKLTQVHSISPLSSLESITFEEGSHKPTRVWRNKFILEEDVGAGQTVRGRVARKLLRLCVYSFAATGHSAAIPSAISPRIQFCF